MKTIFLKIIIAVALLLGLVFAISINYKKDTTVITQYDTYESEPTIPDGDYVGTIDIVIRVDDFYVDDQYYAYVSIPGLNDFNSVKLEILNDAKISLLVSGKDMTAHSEFISLDSFRKIMRDKSKSINGFTKLFKLEIKNNLLEKAIEIEDTKQSKVN